MFRKTCGIYIGDDGIIRLDLMPVPGCLSTPTKQEQKKEKMCENAIDKGLKHDARMIPTGSLAGGTSFDSNLVVYTRREDRNKEKGSLRYQRLS